MLLKGEKSILSNMVILFIIRMQILYLFENTKESKIQISEPICCWITIYNKVINKKRERYDCPNQDPPQSSLKTLSFSQRISSTNNTQKKFK